MKTIRLYLLIVLIGSLLSFYGPWWTIGAVCFILCAAFPYRPAAAGWVSVLASVSVWDGYAIYLHIQSPVDLTERVIGIFTQSIPQLASLPALVWVLIVALLVIAPVGGLSGLAGQQTRRFFLGDR